MSSNVRRINLRHPGTCCICGSGIPTGAQALWSPVAKTLTCPQRCIESGQAGSSAQREYDRRRSKYEIKIRTEHPILGELILFFGNEPQQVKAWKQGAEGEEAVGAALDALAGQRGYRTLHDRKVPGTKANIDHIVITQTGVYVIDAKNYTGMITVERSGGWFSQASVTLRVGSRDCTKLVTATQKQVTLIAAALKAPHPDVTTTGMLAFYKADWPWLGKPQSVDGVLINSRGIAGLLPTSGKFTDSEIATITATLAKAFPQA